MSLKLHIVNNMFETIEIKLNPQIGTVFDFLYRQTVLRIATLRFISSKQKKKTDKNRKINSHA